MSDDDGAKVRAARDAFERAVVDLLDVAEGVHTTASIAAAFERLRVEAAGYLGARIGVAVTGQRAGKMEAAARSLQRHQTATLDAAARTLIDLGVPLDEIEVVHETGSRTDEPFVIHSRAYVRRRAGDR